MFKRIALDLNTDTNHKRRAGWNLLFSWRYDTRLNWSGPLQLAIENQTDRFSLAIDVIDRVPKSHNAGAHLKEWLKGQIIEGINYANTEGVDTQDIQNWK